jgi:hypothetical protein
MYKLCTALFEQKAAIEFSQFQPQNNGWIQRGGVGVGFGITMTVGGGNGASSVAGAN